MDTSKAYKSFTQEEKHFLDQIAQDVAILVSTYEQTSAATIMNHFRKKLIEFVEKWETYNVAYETHSKGKWFPWMGKPPNPLGAIWPAVYGFKWEDATDPMWLQRAHRGVLSYFCSRDMQLLGDYALLGVIHDNVLTHCPPMAKGFLTA